MTHSIVIHPSAETVAEATAARFLLLLIDKQAAGAIPQVALTGGGVGTATLAAAASSPLSAAVDWSRVDFFWGDERFVPAQSKDRNGLQARSALLEHVDCDPGRIHEMAASDGAFGDDVDAAAEAYAAELPPYFDLVMLGMGGEGHVASIFPHSPALTASEPVVAVRDCPKPPPTRISLTLPTIGHAHEVWLLVAGREKAAALAAAVGGSSAAEVPAAGARGQNMTRYLIDREAAADLPAATGEMS